MFEIQKEAVYKTVRETILKSKRAWAIYVGSLATLLQNYGPQILDAFNTNSSTIQGMVNEKIFGTISFLCFLLGFYLNIKNQNITVTKKDIVTVENQE